MSIFPGNTPEPIALLKRSTSVPTSSNTSIIGSTEEDEVKSLDGNNNNNSSSSENSIIDADTSADIWNKDMERFTINNTVSKMLTNEDINNVIDNNNSANEEQNKNKDKIYKRDSMSSNSSKKVLEPPCRDPPEDGVWP